MNKDEFLSTYLKFNFINSKLNMVVFVRCCKPFTLTCIFQHIPKSTKTIFFQNLLKPNKTENAHFIKKIICLLKSLHFLFTHLKLILMNSKHKIINIL